MRGAPLGQPTADPEQGRSASFVANLAFPRSRPVDGTVITHGEQVDLPVVEAVAHLHGA